MFADYEAAQAQIKNGDWDDMSTFWTDNLGLPFYAIDRAYAPR